MIAATGLTRSMSATIAGLRSGLGVEDIAVRERIAAEVIRENVARLRQQNLLAEIYAPKGRAA